MPTSLDDLLAMAVFARVVRERSFTAAAPHLGLSKSVVSERVTALERRLGMRLLHRTTRKLSLTPEGERLYTQFQRVLDAADGAADAVNEVSTRIAGRLRVTVAVGLGLVRIAGWLPEFSRAYPDVSIELSLSDRMVDLISESFDVAIRIAPQLPDSALVARRIASDQRIVIAAPSYLAARSAPATLDDLAAHSCLRLAGVPDEWSFLRRDGSRARVRVQGPLVADNIAVLRMAALEGMGLSMMARSLVVDDLATGRLVQVLDGFVCEELGIFIVSPHREVIPARVRVFIDFVASKMSATTSRPELRTSGRSGSPARTRKKK